MGSYAIKRALSVGRELARRAQTPLQRYNRGKVHVKQMEFHKNLSRIRFVFGGNRTGKTECGAVETVWLALGIHPYRVNRPSVSCFVVSLSTSVQRDVAQAKILKYLDPRYIVNAVMISGSKANLSGGVIDYLDVKSRMGGISRIHFKSCEQGRDKFVGTSLDFVWFDEEPPLDIYDECRMRLIDKGGFLFCTMTPLLGLTYVYENVYLAPTGGDIWHVTMEWADNPYLDEAEVQYFSSTLSEAELESRRYGRFVSGGGLVYPEFDERIHVIEPFPVPAHWQDTLSIDPGLNNPLSCHWYAVNGDGVVYVIAEHYEAKRDISYHAERIRTISAQLNWHVDGKGRLSALIDSAATQKTLAASKSVAELFCEEGIIVNANVDKSLFSGINRVKAYLRNADNQPRLYVFSCCVHLIRELKSYWWGDNDRPRKADDHALDELRYYLASRPAPSKEPMQPQSEISKDKERLLRGARRARLSSR